MWWQWVLLGVSIGVACAYALVMDHHQHGNWLWQVRSYRRKHGGMS